MSLAFLLLKDKSNSIVTSSQTFNAPGNFIPPYGKTIFQITARGTPGNASFYYNTPVDASGGNVAAYYPASGGEVTGSNTFYYNTPVAAQNPSVAGYNYEYVPAVPGNVIAYYPASGGNLNPYYPASGGNVNPSTQGTPAGSNPSTPGTLSGIIWGAYSTSYGVVNYTLYSPGFSYTGFNYNEGGGSGFTLPSPSSNQLGPTRFSNTEQYYTIYFNTTYSYVRDAYNPPAPGNTIYNPPTPGTTNTYYPASGGDTNPYYPAYSNSNPNTPGFYTSNANYNSYVPAFSYTTTVPGNPNVNPYYPAYSNYNTYYPAFSYNTAVPGNYGGTNYVLGVALPGGASDAAAPVVDFTTILIDYTNAGTPIPVPSGGYVQIRNKFLGT